MKLEIEISEEDAACLWCNAWEKIPLKEIVEGLAETEALSYRRAFPHSQYLRKFREAHPAETPVTV